MVRIDLKNVLVTSISKVLSQSSCFIDSFSIWGWAGQISYNGNWVIDESQGNFNILNVIGQLLLCVVDQRLELLFQVFSLLARIVSLVGLFEIISGNVDDFIAVVLSEHVENSLIKRIITQDDFITLCNKLLNKW